MVNNELAILNGSAKVFTTVKAETIEERKRIFNALQKCDVMIKDIPGQEIEFDGVHVREYEKKELKEDGTQRIGHTTILFGTDGKTYVTASNYFFNSIAQIIAANGGNITKENPIKIKIVKRQTKGQGEAIAAEWV